MEGMLYWTPKLKEKKWFIKYRVCTIFYPVFQNEKHSEGQPFLQVWLFFIWQKSVNLEENESWMSMNWLQSHQAIRREINTAVGTVMARKVLVRGMSDVQEQTSIVVTWGWHQPSFINIFLHEVFKMSAMLPKSIKQFNSNMGRIWVTLKPLPSKANTAFFESWAWKIYSCYSEAT